MLMLLLPMALMPLRAEDQPIRREKQFTAYTPSFRAIDFWLHSRADLGLVSAATSMLDGADESPFFIRQTAPDAVFLSAQAIQMLDEQDRSELRSLAARAVPIICECGEYLLSQVAGFAAVEQPWPAPLQYFVYRRSSSGILRSSVLLDGITDASTQLLQGGILYPFDTAQRQTIARFDTTDSKVPDQLRASLLGEAIRQSLEYTVMPTGDPVRAASSVPAAGEGWWSPLSDMQRKWTWFTPEVCAATTQCWDYSKKANKFTVTADFYKIPDGKLNTDYYLVQLTSEHVANYTGRYLSSASSCSDGWVGWYASERWMKVERRDGVSKLEEYVPTASLAQQSSSWTLGGQLEVGYKSVEAGFNASFTVTSTVSDATVADFSKRPSESAEPDHVCSWRETFIGPRYGTAYWKLEHPSDASRLTFNSKRGAIYSTSNPAAGVTLAITPKARFEKDRVDWRPFCTWWDIIKHPYVIDSTGPVLDSTSSTPAPWVPLNVRWNYPPDVPSKPSLTIPANMTALWTNSPLIVSVPATADRDGDTVYYSVDFGDGNIGGYGGAEQTHSWTKPGAILLKARTKDMYGSTSGWSESVRYTIKGLDRIQIEGGTQIPEMQSMQLLCVATMSDASTQTITSSGWEGGGIRWSVSSPYATISSTGMLQAVSAQGTDRVVTVTATYTLKGIEKTTSQNVIVKAVASPAPAMTSVVSGASFLPGISGSAWTTIYGTNLAATTRPWRNDEIVGGRLPTVLDGVSVTMNGQAAALCYISPSQLNVQTPSGLPDGPVTVRVTTAQGSVAVTAQLNRFAPGFFTLDGKYVAAQHADFSYVASPSQGAAASPARPGELVILYASGFGPTVPELPSGTLITTAAALANPVSVWIGDRIADVAWKGMSGAGLWQLNVTIPADLTDGDATVVAEVGGRRTQSGVLITIRR